MAADNSVILDYTNRDFRSIRAQLVGLARGFLPEWETVGESGDFGTLLLELYAYMGDVLNYYIDRNLSEAFLGTAVRRQSVMFIADMLGYTPVGQNAAVAPVQFRWQWDPASTEIASEEFSITGATQDGGEVTLSLLTNDTSVNIVEGQTIIVSGLGDPYDGTFLVTSTTEANEEENTPFKLTYDFSGADEYMDGTGTVIPAPGANVTTGTVIKIPAGTTLVAAGGRESEDVVFELNFDVILDSRQAAVVRASDPDGAVAVRVTSSASEGQTSPPASVGTSKGIPSAEFVIPVPGVFTGTVEVYTREGGQLVTWSEVRKTSLAGPTQSVYTTYVDDSDFTHILFGDGIAGRIPPAEADIIVGYRYGVGAQANTIAKGAINSHNDEAANAAGVTVSNPRSPSGGSDVESVESMRYSIPRATAVKERAVTLEDFRSLALQVPGVNKAVAYGQTYANVFIRVAASSDSVPYNNVPITHYSVTSGASNAALTFVTADSDVSTFIPAGDIVDVAGFEDDRVALNSTRAAVRTWGASAPVSIGKIAKQTHSNGGLSRPLAEIETIGPHGFLPGQTITVSGLDAAAAVGDPATATTNLDGTFIIESVYSTTVDGETISNGIRYRAEAAAYNLNAIDVSGVAELDPNPIPLATVSGVPSMVDFNSGIATADTDGLVPVGGDEGSPYLVVLDPAMRTLMDATEEYLADKKLIGSYVFAEPVEWYDTDIKITVTVKPLYSRKSVKAAVENRLKAIFSFERLDFGRPVTTGDVYRNVLSVDGVDYITLDKMFPTGTTPTVADITTPPYMIARLNQDPAHLSSMVSAVGGLVNS